MLFRIESLVVFRCVPRFSRHRSVAILLTLSLASGCGTPGLTGHLWSSEWSEFNEPAPDPRLSVSASETAGDYLVEYDELLAQKDFPVRRAYWLLANDTRTEASRKPRFEKIIPTSLGKSLPVATTNVPPPTETYVLLKPQTRTFEVIDHGANLGRHSLPVYKSAQGLPIQIALTPFAVAADLTLIGIVIGILCWPRSLTIEASWIQRPTHPVG